MLLKSNRQIANSQSDHTVAFQGDGVFHLQSAGGLQRHNLWLRDALDGQLELARNF
jgi:hypothetical protein